MGSGVEALLALEDGSLFSGYSIGANRMATGEVVFNTSMTGYREILTDPSYCRQIVALTGGASVLTVTPCFYCVEKSN